MDWIAVLGFSAALCSTVSFVPQAYRIVRTRDTSSISTGMYAITSFGFLLWLGYGAALGQWPLILTNAICLALASFILFLKISPRPTIDKVADTLTPHHDA